MRVDLPGYLGEQEPLSGTDVQVTVTVKGQRIVDASLTQLWFATRYSADPHFLVVYFSPFPAPDEDSTEPPEPVQPVYAALSLVAVPADYSPWPGQPRQPPEPFWPEGGSMQLVRTAVVGPCPLEGSCHKPCDTQDHCQGVADRRATIVADRARDQAAAPVERAPYCPGCVGCQMRPELPRTCGT